ncbi:hypothetical protein [uncultured Alistipes sp.]|jgi:hypothetical protein|uniref:hypothetical protein n=1 Tax=uncultured Alistipes sp. TaxID=538949 RepID=UPI0025CE342D|nr:hypothetical protein [uncultured Alistipes sp.]
MKLPYKYRGVLLLALLVILLPWAAWRFALRDTVGAWRDCRRLGVQLAAAPPQVQEQQSVQVAQDREMILSGLLLDAVRQAAARRSAEVTGYEPLVTLQQDGLEIHTAQLTLSGSYAALLQVVGELERSLPGCRLCSLEWRTAADRRTRRTSLGLKFYVQQVVLKQ